MEAAIEVTSESNILTPDTNSILFSSATPLKLPPSLIFFISNIKALIPVKLEYANGSTNFPVWKTLVDAALRANHLLDFVHGRILCPSAEISSLVSPENSTQTFLTPNPNFVEWTAINAHLLSCLLSTLHPTILPSVQNISLVTEVWNTLCSRFALLSQSQIHNYQQELGRLQKGSKSMDEYLNDIQSILDRFSVAGVVLNNHQIILHILQGLPREYRTVASQIRNWPGVLQIEDVKSMLRSEDIHIKLNESSSDSLPNAIAFQTFANRSMNSARGFRGFRGSVHRGGRGVSGLYRGAQSHGGF